MTKLSETAIVSAVAARAARGVGRKTIAALQKRTETTSGDPLLRTVWDEVCVQVQYEESTLWDAYDETVRSFVAAYVEELPEHEREAIWLQTDQGSDWDCEDPADREPYPVVNDDIVGYVVHEFVYSEAGRWSNPRIRAFIERSSMRD
ncbi:MAG TPA: hypothetical protein VNZ53_46845 [Steroidobacteraceae bacterium]|jgi:hypothetical protein|nr:hypothetical protein [Steroidobacteraceae bacterium]